MKILYIDPFVLPDFLGGSQKSLLDIMDSMNNKNNKIILATPGEGMLSQVASEKNIEIINLMLPSFINTRISIFSKNYFNYCAALINVLNLLIAALSIYKLIRKNKPDIIHSNQMLISIPAGIASKVLKVPCLWHIRENPSKHISRFILKFYSFIGTKFSSKIIVNSAYTASFFSNTNLRHKINIVPIGINLNKNTSLTIQNKTNQVKNISIFGRIIPMKGHNSLIKSLNLLDIELDYKLFIYGNYESDNDYYLSLKKLIENLNLASKINFLGFVSDVTKAVAKSDLIISASLEAESFGRTLIEGMAMGKPIIATDVGAHSEIIDDGINGFLVKAGDTKALSKKIKMILHDEELALRLGSNGKHKYDKYYTRDIYKKNIENIYFRLINRKGFE